MPTIPFANKRISRIQLWMVAAAPLVIVIVYFGLSWYIVGQALEGEIAEFEHHPDDFGMMFEEVEFTPRGDDSITLRGWWLPSPEPLATIVWAHGLDKNRAERLPMMRELVDFGFSVLVFDFRGHGESDAVPLGAGFLEVRDVDGAIDFVLGEKDVRPDELLLMGQSFGAAMVLMAGVDEPAVAGVYADSAFASLEDVMIGEIEKRTPFPSWVASALRLGIISMGNVRGIDIRAVRPEAVVSQYTMPLGIAHCRADERIPEIHAVRIRLAKPGPVTFNLFPGCAHADAYDDFHDQFMAIVTDYFMDRLGLLEPEIGASS